MITIKHKNFEAIILKQGAQLIHFQPAGSQKLLWHTDLSHFAHGRPFRGGVPVCWPWFGKAHIPAHGFARIMPWELLSRVDYEEGVTLEWRLVDSEATRAIWNHPFEIGLVMRLGNSFEMTFSVHTDVETTGALHTYLYASDLSRVAVQGLGKSYIDSLQQNSLHVSSSSILKIEGEVDRIYPSASEISTMTDGKRVVEVQHENFSDVVVWNPYQDLPDMAQDEYKKMLCIETARISRPFKKDDFMGLTCRVVEPYM